MQPWLGPHELRHQVVLEPLPPQELHMLSTSAAGNAGGVDARAVLEVAADPRAERRVDHVIPHLGVH